MTQNHETHHHLHLERVIFYSGLDFNSNPILIICPFKLNSKVKLDLIQLTLISLNRFNHLILNHLYSIIIFASPSENIPSLSQIISSYNLINQTIRKNLHSLIIVHPSFWSKITTQVFLKTIVSSKVYKKLKWVKNLSSLAHLVPIHQICIPLEVYKYNLTVEPQIIVPPSSRQPPVFNVDLIELMGSHSQLGLPQIIQDCNQCITQNLKSEGLFRRPPSLATTQIIRDAYDQRFNIQIHHYQDAPYLSASLIKLFLRELPHPIFSFQFYPLFKNCPNIHLQPILQSKLDPSHLIPSNLPVLQYILHQILLNLNHPSRTLLDCVLKLCHNIALHSEFNKMDPHNLATCLAPTMIRSNDLITDAMMCQLPNPSSTTPSSHTSTASNPGFTTFSSILKFMISCYPLISDSITGPISSNLTTPITGSILTGEESTYSSHDNLNSLSSLSESSIESIPSKKSFTTSSSEAKKCHHSNQNPRVSCPLSTSLTKDYFGSRCPVSQVGLSHSMNLGQSSNSLVIDHLNLVNQSGKFNHQPKPPLNHYQSFNQTSFSNSIFLPSISDRMVPSPHSQSRHFLRTTLPIYYPSSTIPIPKDEALHSGSDHHLDELD